MKTEPKKTLTPEILRKLKFKTTMHLNGGSHKSVIIQENKQYGLGIVRETDGSPNYKLTRKGLRIEGREDVEFDLLKGGSDLFEQICRVYNDTEGDEKT